MKEVKRRNTGKLPRQEFVKLVEGRVNRACKNIDLISNLARPKRFEFTIEDILQVRTFVNQRIDAMEAKFLEAQGAKKKFELEN